MRSAGMRISTHPGQYIVLSSIREDVVAAAIAELAYHDRLLSAFGLGDSHKVVLHLGSGVADPRAAYDRFAAGYRRLLPGAAGRLVLENDERWPLDTTLVWAERLELPVVFDAFHHELAPSMERLTVRELVLRAAETWRPRDGRQEVHFSNQAPEKRPGAHAETIDSDAFARFAEEVGDLPLDCVLEVKDKERSVLRARELAPPDRRIGDVSRSSSLRPRAAPPSRANSVPSVAPPCSTTNGRARLVLVQAPDIRYARSGDVAIAYAVLGDGPIDLVAVHGFAGNLDFELESPYWRPFHDRLASFSRHVMFDRRGTGLSDRMREVPTLETLWTTSARCSTPLGPRARSSSERLRQPRLPAVRGHVSGAQSGPCPLRPVAKGTRGAGLPVGATARRATRHQPGQAHRRTGHGRGGLRLEPRHGPFALADDADFIRTIARNQPAAGTSPGAALTIRRMAVDVDVRDVLPVIRVPTLVLNMPSARGGAEYVTARIPGARRARRPAPATWSPSSAIACLTKSRRAVRCVRSARTRAGYRARDRPLHRHRQFHGEGDGARRSAPGPTSSTASPRWCALTSTASADARWTRPGTAFRRVRRADPRDPLRDDDREIRS